MDRGREPAEGRPLDMAPVTPAPAVFTPRPQAHWLATAEEMALLTPVLGGLR